jgi:hypothetical protein
MRLSHIFWALLVVLGLLVAPTPLLRMTPLGLAAGVAYSVFYIFLWGCVLVASPLMIVLARTRKAVGYHSFLPTFLFMANLYFALFSVSQFLATDGNGGFRFWNLLFGMFNVLWAIVLVTGVCVKKYAQDYDRFNDQ